MTSRVWGVRQRRRYDLADGLCVGHKEPDIWFDPSRAAEARDVCCSCPVKILCSVAALEFHEQFGVWGGTDADERGMAPSVRY